MSSILESIQGGKIAGFSEEKPEMIMTSISRVFIFRKNKRVLKIYRRDNEYWNTNFSDLSGGKIRKEFIKQDFEWNRYFNPNVYVKLSEAHKNDGLVILAEPAGGDELVIEMSLIDTSHFFIPTLASKQVFTDEEYFSIGQQLATLKDGFKQKPDLGKNWYEIFKERINDLRVWMENVPDFSKEIISECVSFLKSYTEINKVRFESIGEDEMVATIDAHGENAMYSNKELSFIDIFLPKELWRLAPKEIDILRIGLDVYVLRSERAYQSYIAGIKSETTLDEQDELFYLVYLSALMGCIQSTIAENTKSRKPIAQKYHSFFRHHLMKGISNFR